MVDVIVIDTATRVPVDEIKRRNIIGVCRYIAPVADRWKIITLDEYRDLTANGIEVILNWEHAAKDWLGGASTGKSHGEMAVFQARQLGYPAGRVIPGSCDFDITRSQWVNAGRAYATAYATAVRAGGYRPGVYGPWDVLTWVSDEGIMDAFWQAGMSTAWSQFRNAKRHPKAHLRQVRQFSIGTIGVDQNEVLALPLFGRASGPASTTLGDEDMLYTVVEGGDLTGAPEGSDPGAIYIGSPKGPKWITGGEWGSVGEPKPMECESYARIKELCPSVEDGGTAPTQDQVNTAVWGWLDQHVTLS